MSFENQYSFQHTYLFGRTLNIGCDNDSSGLAARGAVNVDRWTFNTHKKTAVPAHVVADCRDLSRGLDGKPLDLYGQFDTAILGDILEHFTDRGDVLKTINEAKKCLREGGRILITCPEDYRPIKDQVGGEYPEYFDDVPAYHTYPVTKEVIQGWLDDTGLTALLWDRIDYVFCQPSGGHGVVAVPKTEGGK